MGIIREANLETENDYSVYFSCYNLWCKVNDNLENIHINQI